MKAIYDAGVKEISRNGIDEKMVSYGHLMWKTSCPMLFDYGYTRSAGFA